MEKKLSKRKMLRRKYKHYAAAALAGAAIMTGVSMPATTFAAEHHPINMDQQTVSSRSDSGAHYDTRNNNGSHYDTRSNSGSHYDTRFNNSTRNVAYNTNARSNNGAHFDTRSNSGSHYDTRYNDSSRYSRYGDGWHKHNNSWPSSGDNRGLYKDGQIYYSNDSNRYYDSDYGYGNYLTSPLTVARDSASSYGFNANRDTFTLLSQSANKATVQVIKNDSNQRFRMNLTRTNGEWSVTSVRGMGNTAVAAAYR
jgi:hypothetical protein